MAAPRPPLFEQTWFLTVTEASAAWRREGERYELVWRQILKAPGRRPKPMR